MSNVKAYFIQHCDHEDCDLGSFETTCPNCNKNIIDYDIWWKQDEIWSGSIIELNCSECKTLLSLSYNKLDYEYELKIKENEIPTK